MSYDFKPDQLAFHRNGVGGRPFYCAIGKFKTDDGKERRMLVVHFRGKDCATAVFDIDLLNAENIAFGDNSWRGDHFHAPMEQAIEGDTPLSEGTSIFPSAISAAVIGGKPE